MNQRSRFQLTIPGQIGSYCGVLLFCITMALLLCSREEKELVCDALCRIRTEFCDANKLLFLLLSKSASCAFSNLDQAV